MKGINAPWTTSAGRIFDAVASISGLRQIIKFEGQAAMELEFAARSERTEDCYPFDVLESNAIRITNRRDGSGLGPLDSFHHSGCSGCNSSGADLEKISQYSR